jgi:hypothetical protein
LGTAAFKPAIGQGLSVATTSGPFVANTIPVLDGTGTLVDSGCTASGGILTCGSAASTRLGVRLGIAPTDTLINGNAHDAVFYLDLADGYWKMRRLDGTVLTLSGATTITSFLNAQHKHNNAAAGGTLDESAFQFADVTAGNATSAAHGLLPKLPNNGALCFRGDGTFGACAAPGGTSGQVQVNLNGEFSGLSTSGNGSYVVTAATPAADGCAQYASGNLTSTGTPCGSGGGTTVNANTVAAAIYCADTSITANTILCAPATTFPASYAAGQTIRVKIALTNTGPAVINVANLGNKSVTKNGTAALASGDLRGGGIYTLTYDGTGFVAALGPAAGHSIAAVLTCATSSASGTAESCSTSPSFVPAAGDIIVFQSDVANSGPFTLNVNTLGPKPVVKNGIMPLAANDILASPFDTLLVYDGTNWEMQGQTGNAASGGVTAGAGITVSGPVVTWNRFDTSLEGFYEPFMYRNSGTYYGHTFHALNTVTGSCTAADLLEATSNPQNHPGNVRITLPTTANPACTFSQQGYSTTAKYRLMASDFDYQAVVYLSAATVNLRIGTTNSNTVMVGSDALDVRYDASQGDTTWVAEMRGAGTSSTVAFAAAPTVGWHTFLVQRRAAGQGGNPTIYMTVDGVTRTYCASGCDRTLTNAPSSTVALLPRIAYGFTGTPGAGTFVEIDAIGFGLSNLNSRN